MVQQTSQPAELAYCSSRFRAKGGVLHVQASELRTPHWHPVGRHDVGLTIRSEKSGVISTWLHHWWADTFVGSTRSVYVYGPSQETCARVPMLAGWRVHVHV